MSTSNPPNQINLPLAAIPVYLVEGGAAVSSGNPLSTSGGGGGGGGGLSDTILVDTTGTQFLARDNGTTITYVTLGGVAYTPVGAIAALTGGNPATLVTGQAIIVTTGTAVRLTATSTPLINGIIIKSLSTNNATGQTVGASGITNAVAGSGNGYILFPGEASSFGVTNLNVVYVNGTAGDIFTYQGN